jgi:hypothetical protein
MTSQERPRRFGATAFGRGADKLAKIENTPDRDAVSAQGQRAPHDLSLALAGRC